MHAAATNGFYDIEDLLAITEHIKDGRELPEILRKGSIPHQVTGDAEELAHHDADHLGTFRHFNARQFFHRQQVRQVVVYTTKVIDAVGIGNIGMPRLPLGHLLCAAMVKPDIGHGIHDIFSIEL